MFLIDTNIAIHLRDGHREMTARVNALPRRPAVSLTARMEREGGVYRHPAFADARRAAVDAVVGMFEVEPVDGAVIAAYGRIVVACGLSRRKITTGRPPPPRWWAT